ncbi:MAG: hypothetical protein HYV02_03765 [Deltaproteobacteria bacterium]|nr:hypothetical protein [Deltaproteobacteria bacterium]
MAEATSARRKPAEIRKGGGAAPLETAKEPGEKHRLEPYFDFWGRKFFNPMNKKNIFFILFTILVIGVFGCFAFIKNQTPTPQTQQDVFFSQEECEQKTGKTCSLQMCDYVPPGKTFEEVCGKDFKKGWVPQTSVVTNQNSTSESACQRLNNEIENDLTKANYCQNASDCSVLALGGSYVEFGCYHFINKEVDKNKFYAKMQIYTQQCRAAIDRCVPAPKPSCVSNKCAFIDN